MLTHEEPRLFLEAENLSTGRGFPGASKPLCHAGHNSCVFLKPDQLPSALQSSFSLFFLKMEIEQAKQTSEGPLSFRQIAGIPLKW